MNINNLEMAQSSMELFGCVVSFMVAIFITLNNISTKSMKMFKWMFFATSALLFSDAMAYIFRGNYSVVSKVVTRVSNFSVFTLNMILAILFMEYLYASLEEKGATISKVYRILVWIFIGISFVMLIINIPTKFMYFFDVFNYYHRQNGWYLYTGLMALSLLTLVILVILARKSITIIRAVSYLVYILIPIVAVFLQTMFYGISFTSMGIMVASMFMLAVYLYDWSRTNIFDSVQVAERRRSLEITIMFSIMVISMFASIASCLIAINKISDEKSIQDSKTMAHIVSESLSKEFLMPITVTETMAKDYNMVKYLKESGKSPESETDEIKSYLEYIENGFGYKMVYAVCDKSKAYYTAAGISKYIDTDHDKQDIWYKNFLEANVPYKLEVDTDITNDWSLSVFVNREVTDANGDLLGVCGIGVEMTELQKLLEELENTYNIKISLVDADGLIQIDTNSQRILNDTVDFDYNIIKKKDFKYTKNETSSQLVKYMEDLNWYLIIEDLRPDKINVSSMTFPSIVIFIIGIFMMGVAFFFISKRDSATSRELVVKKQASITDDLTGLTNRRGYDEDCALLIDTGKYKELAIIAMDVNGLKKVNDNISHMAGDELLVGAAGCMKEAFSSYGRVYRVGGDEFIALLHCSPAQVKTAVNDFERLVNNWSGHLVDSASVSKGIVFCADFADKTFEEMENFADKRMYEDKREYYNKSGINRRRV